jgi:fructose-1,6-bisphosphatase II
MRSEFSHIDIDGRIVIGEGERDEAPMLYIGEEVGSGATGSPAVDIAVDPLEGTTICAHGGPNAIACVALSKRGGMLHAPDTYMWKIAVGPTRSDPSTSAAHRPRTSTGSRRGRTCRSRAHRVHPRRPRHKDLIEEVRKAGARIRLIRDGDVSGAIATAIPEAPIDVLMGIGGAPEGVLAAAALRALGGEIQGRVARRNDDERERAKLMGVEDPDGVLLMSDLVSGEDAIFAATGVTDGDFLDGVRFRKGGAISIRSWCASRRPVRLLTAHHDFIRGRCSETATCSMRRTT